MSQQKTRSETELSMDTQKVVLNAFTGAFSETQILPRYLAPRPRNLPRTTLNVGYHDESFAVSTLPTKPWHCFSLLADAGTTENRKTRLGRIGKSKPALISQE
ncbi:MAG: hypothetical protein AB8B55_23975 [Mariniblastus sp.]